MRGSKFVNEEHIFTDNDKAQAFMVESRKKGLRVSKWIVVKVCTDMFKEVK